MKIIRCLVMDCVVYTQFANGIFVRDDYASHEEAREMQQAMLHLSGALHGQEEVA